VTDLVQECVFGSQPNFGMMLLTTSSHDCEFGTKENTNPNNRPFLHITTANTVDLALAKRVNQPVASTGDTLRYTIDLTNNGPHVGTNIAVTDLLPIGLTLISATPDQGTYDGGTGIWNVGTMLSGASNSLILTTTVNPGTEGEKRLPALFADVILKEGDIVRVERPGGGGFGDPLDRNPEDVLKDVSEKYVSLESAREIYGIGINEVTMKIDEQETASLRSRLRKASS